MIKFILGLFVGSTLGVVTMCLMNIASNADRMIDGRW